MLRTHSRSFVTGVALTFFALALAAGSASACKNNPFNSAQTADDNLPLIASNETGKCGGEMAPEGKPDKAMKCGEGKCGDDSMSTSGKPTGEEKKCEGSATTKGKPSGSSQCGSGK